MFDHQRQISFGPGHQPSEPEEPEVVAATEEDFQFIQEVLESASTELQQKQLLPNAMLSLISMNKQELESAVQHFSNEVQTQFQEFQRVIEFSSKFLNTLFV